MEGKLVKKDGIIWFVTQQDLYGKHFKWSWMGTYEEDKPVEENIEDKPKKKKKAKKESED